MDYTEQQKAQFRVAFTRRRRAQLLAAPPVVALLMLIVLTHEPSGTTLLGLPLSVAAMLAALATAAVVLFSFFNWRCPACGHYLGNGFNPHFCSKCGAPLQGDGR